HDVRLIDYFNQLLYVSIHPDLLLVKDVVSGHVINEVPEIAISNGEKERVLETGKRAKQVAAEQSALLLNPFKHPRCLLSDFTVAEVVIREFVRKLHKGGNRLFLPNPNVIMHPRPNPEGGFTQIELRALRELAIGAAGARKIGIWLGED